MKTAMYSKNGCAVHNMNAVIQAKIFMVFYSRYIVDIFRCRHLSRHQIVCAGTGTVVACALVPNLVRVRYSRP